jgi:hypothetical protein
MSSNEYDTKLRYIRLYEQVSYVYLLFENRNIVFRLYMPLAFTRLLYQLKEAKPQVELIQVSVNVPLRIFIKTVSVSCPVPRWWNTRQI